MNALQIVTQQKQVTTDNGLTAVSERVGQALAKNALQIFYNDLTLNTVKAYRESIVYFCQCLNQSGVDIQASDLQENASAWVGIDSNHLELFVMWLSGNGYSVATIKSRLYAIRAICGALDRANVINHETFTKMQLVKALSQNADEKRETKRRETAKKQHATAVTIGSKKANDLIYADNDTNKGKRDNALMAIMLHHGLRVSEVVLLTVGSIDLESGLINFFRPKVKSDEDKAHGKQKLTGATLEALVIYLSVHPFANDKNAPLFLAVNRGDNFGSALSIGSIKGIVRAIGKSVGIDNLSPHDLRHALATHAGKAGNVNLVMSILGHKKPDMSLRYIKASSIDNEGLDL